MKRLSALKIIFITALLLFVSCVEQSPKRFPAPEFGEVEVVLDGFKATVRCEVSGTVEGLSYGFILKGSDGSQDFALEPQGRVLRTEIEGLMPSTDYSILAIATNGINKVSSTEKHFRTGDKQEDDPQYDPGEEKKDVVNMPDATFRKLILSQFDGNNDGQLSLEEAEAVNVIECCSDDIRSLEGVECFTNLERIICRGSGADSDRRTGRLTKVDLSNNLRLRNVVFDGNNLTELLLPEKNSNIEDIHCYLNKLEYLDISGCPKLKSLWCWNNSLASLDLSGNKFITDLRCGLNKFADGLDVSANNELRYFYCEDAQLPSIDIGANTELLEVVCRDNFIKSIDVSHNTKIVRLECNSNIIASLDVSMLPDLLFLKFDTNFIKEIDLSHNLKLKELCASANLLTEIDVSMLSRLEHLFVDDNQIPEPVDLSVFPELKDYGGNNLPLGRMPDFSHNPKLQAIHICGSGGAKYMDSDFFRDWPEIRCFNICCYPGETLDLSQNAKIEDIWASDMQNVRILDLSASPNLRFICINDNKNLEKVYVHRNVDISKLKVEANDVVHAVIEHKQ